MSHPLGKYYTEKLFSELLVNRLTSIKPETVLDMGFGSGALTNAAYEKWQEAAFYAIEINHNLNNVPNENFKLNLFQADVLNENIRRIINIQYGTFDLAVCNPPYLKLDKSISYTTLLLQASLTKSISLRYYTSDLIFLAYNLLFLRDGGELGIILPDGLLTSHEFKVFRDDLISNYTIKSIIQLPDRIFAKTEAQTHVIILTKDKPYSNIVEMSIVNKEGQIADSITVLQSGLGERMDFRYQKWMKDYIKPKFTLSDKIIDLKRGNLTKKQLEELSLPYTHSTNFKDVKEMIFDEIVTDSNYSIMTAREGDIIMTRVGKRCLGKVAMVKKGHTYITDCVYRIRVSNENFSTVWNALQADYKCDWLSVFAHGVCSQVISKHDLLNYPLY
ncbi:HsdM family class I SAM-dependent methyltransferase [Spirosoma gilvum]